jgi:hypothetical protein
MGAGSFGSDMFSYPLSYSYSPAIQQSTMGTGSFGGDMMSPQVSYFTTAPVSAISGLIGSGQTYPPTSYSYSESPFSMNEAMQTYSSPVYPSSFPIVGNYGLPTTTSYVPPPPPTNYTSTFAALPAPSQSMSPLSPYPINHTNTTATSGGGGGGNQTNSNNNNNNGQSGAQTDPSHYQQPSVHFASQNTNNSGGYTYYGLTSEVGNGSRPSNVPDQQSRV